MLAVQRLVNFLCQPGANLRFVAIANGLYEQVLETRLLEDFAQDVEHAAF